MKNQALISLYFLWWNPEAFEETRPFPQQKRSRNHLRFRGEPCVCSSNPFKLKPPLQQQIPEIKGRFAGLQLMVQIQFSEAQQNQAAAVVDSGAKTWLNCCSPQADEQRAHST